MQIHYTYFGSLGAGVVDIHRKIFDGDELICIIVAKDVDMLHASGKITQDILREAFNKQLLIGIEGSVND